MCQNNKHSSGIVLGFLAGAAIGAGATLLFGTEKGKKLRRDFRENYPEFFTKLDDVLEDTKENLDEQYESIAEQVAKIKEEVSGMSDEASITVKEKVNNLGAAVESLGEKIQEVSKPRRFLRSGKKL